MFGFMKKFMNLLHRNIYAIAIINLLLAMLLYSLCRVEFYLVNADYFPDISAARLVEAFYGGLKFDLAAVLYTNMLYLLMMLVPLGFRYNGIYQKTAQWIFYIFNAVGIIANCADSVYFRFTNRRTTSSFFSEFQNDNNLLKIMGEGVIGYWYVTLAALLLLFLLYRLYFKPAIGHKPAKLGWLYYVKNTVALVVSVFFIVSGMRGGFGSFVRPITLSNANAYVDKPLEASIVLNTPFCVLRTAGKKPYKDPHYFKTERELVAVYEPVIEPRTNADFRSMNVVVFIMESFSKEFVGELNRNHEGYTPFLDSLIREGLTFEYTFANGRKSIDAMPSVLSSIPRFYEPYILTSYSGNKVSGIAGELDKMGYYTAFFHGAPNGSMGFDAFARLTGYKDYFGMTEYGNDADYDGTWAIWDEEFFQFYANKMTTFKQPFMTALFSASSHHPFRVPERYKDVYKEEGHLLYKCIRYSDNALRKFFATAKKQPWFQNTIFVITADHTNELSKKEYVTEAGHYKVPIIFYTPNGDLRGRREQIAQQIDIMPTVLGYLNYNKPYVAFGHNLLDSTYTQHYAINHNDQMFQFFTDSLMLLFDGEQTRSVYNFVDDVCLTNNIKDSLPQTKIFMMETKVKAIVQQYIERMLENRMSIDNN